MRNPNEQGIIRLRQISAARNLVADVNKRLTQLPPPNDSEIKVIMQQMGDAYYRLGLASGVYRLDSDSPDTSFVRPDPVLEGRRIIHLTSYKAAVSSDEVQWKEPVRIPGAPDKPAPLPIPIDRSTSVAKPLIKQEKPQRNPGKDFRATSADPRVGRIVIDDIDRAEEQSDFTPISKPGLYRLTQLIQFADPDLLKRAQVELTPERVTQLEAIRRFIEKRDPEIKTKIKKTTADVQRRLKKFFRDPELYLQRCTDPNEKQLLLLLEDLSVKPVSRAQFLEHSLRFE